MKKGPQKHRSAKKGKSPIFWIFPAGLLLAIIIVVLLPKSRTPDQVAQRDSQNVEPVRPAPPPTPAPTDPPPTVDWRQAIERLPKEERASAYSDAGDELLGQKNFLAASEAFQKSLQYENSSESIHYNFAIALAAAGKTNEAITAYEEALKIAPDYAEAHNNLGNLLMRQNDYEGAMKHFREAISVNPGDAKSYNNLGIALVRLGLGEDAVKQFGKAVETDPNYLEGRFNLAQGLIGLKQPEKAAEQLRAALKVNPNFTPAKATLEKISQAPNQ